MCKKCGSEKVVYVFSDKKIKRYMAVCAECGQFIKWIPNKEWEKIKDSAVILKGKE